MRRNLILFSLLAPAVFLAACGGGGGGSDIAPRIAYPSSSYNLTTRTAVHLVPTNSGGAASWAASPALPAGLTLNASTGEIDGTATTLAPAAVFKITATNSAGASTVALTIVVESGVLIDLGHPVGVIGVRITDERLLSFDGGHWVLWDRAGQAILARGTGCNADACIASAGDIFVALTPNPQNGAESLLTVHALADGAVLGKIIGAFGWFQIATDGSYICAGRSTGLTAWTPSGTIITSIAGDYSSATAYAAPGAILFATGITVGLPVSTIETISLPSGAITTSPRYQGQFLSWFADGEHFISQGASIWIYDKSVSAPPDAAANPGVAAAGGYGSWWWILVPHSCTVNVYQVGSGGVTTASYCFPSPLTVAHTASGIVGFLDFQAAYPPPAQTLHLIDLTGMAPVQIDRQLPAGLASVAVLSASQWTMGTQSGVIVDSGGAGGSLRTFGYGALTSMAGSSARVALATQYGSVYSFDATTKALETQIIFPASKLALSADGSELVATDGASIEVFAMPAGTLTYTWPAASGATIADIAVTPDGATLYQAVTTPSNTCSESVTPVLGGPPSWSSLGEGACSTEGLTQVSPDGTLVATLGGPGTLIYRNNTLLLPEPGWPLVWIDNSHILLANLVNGPGGFVPSGATIVDLNGSATQLPSLPETGEVQLVGADAIYPIGPRPNEFPQDGGPNSIFSLSTGKAIWNGSTQTRGAGAVAGPRVYFVSGYEVLAEAH